ncbi:MAG: protein kinase, partial [Anaerolineales bacterium]|nr:protein kinase [Anaerolineales bacterium]
MMTNLVGQRISHYQITALLGQGRIGMVYQATDLETQEPVALKIVSLHLTQQAGFRERFLQEVQTIPRLDHPSIVKVHEAGVDTERDILFLTMEYVTGRSLMAHLERLHYRQEHLPLVDALQIGVQIAEALDYAHRKRVLHRDIRPNVILFRYEEMDKEPRAVISDFSLMSLLEAETEPFAPSLPYLSPEQCLKREADARSDLYSLGIVLYELIVGQRPFPISTWEEAVRMHTYEDPPAPRQTRPDLPVNVEEILLKAIAKQPANRFQSGEELAEVLRHALALLPKTDSDALSGAQIEDVITQTDIPPIVGLRATQWASDADRLTITQDAPHFLNREIITIGRSELNDIVLSDASVTRRHAQLERAANGWQVRDLGSKNGTFLDEKRLLPDIPEEWLNHQTLRVGANFLQLQRGKGFAFRMEPFSVRIAPTETEVVPGKEQTLNLYLENNIETPLELELAIDRLPPEWVTLPGMVNLPPMGQVVIPFFVHPPLARDVLPGKHRFLVLVTAKSGAKHQATVPGVLDVQSATAVFSVDLYPSVLQQKGTCRLTIRNESINTTTYTISGQDMNGDIRFGEWRLHETQTAAGQAKTAVSPQKKRSNTRVFRQLPWVSRLRSAPRRWWYKVANVPRNALERIVPGLGRMIPVVQMPQMSMPTSGGSGKTATATPVRTERPFPTRREVDEVMYPEELRTQITIPGGQEGVLYLRVLPRRRPFFGERQTLPFTAQISADEHSRQSSSGQLMVNPRIRAKVSLTTILLVLILFCVCGAGTLAVARYNQTARAILTAPRDMDNDGLSNLAELYVYRT